MTIEIGYDPLKRKIPSQPKQIVETGRPVVFDVGELSDLFLGRVFYEYTYSQCLSMPPPSLRAAPGGETRGGGGGQSLLLLPAQLKKSW